MLKYEFDKEKKETFLAFWKISESQEFDKLSQDVERFFLQLTHLNPQGFTALGQIVQNRLTNQEARIENFRLKFKEPKPQSFEIALEENTLELLDSLHLINLLKDRTSLFNQKNRIEMTSEFRSWLEKIPLLNSSYHNSGSSGLNIFGTSDQALGKRILPKIDFDFKLNPKEEKLLKRIITSFCWGAEDIIKEIKDEETLLKLKQEGIIDFYLNFKTIEKSDWVEEEDSDITILEPTISINPKWINFQLVESENGSIGFPTEQFAYAYFYLDLKLYEMLSSRSMKAIYPWSPNSKTQLLDIIATGLIELNQTSFDGGHDELSRSYLKGQTNGQSETFTQHYLKLNSIYEKNLFLLNNFFLIYSKGLTKLNQDPTYPEKESAIFLGESEAWCRSDFNPADFYLELSALNFHPQLTVVELLFLINLQRGKKHRSSLREEELSNYLKIYGLLGLMVQKPVQKPDYLLFEVNALDYSLNNASGKLGVNSAEFRSQPSSVTLDSDLTIMGYKEQMSPCTIFELLFFAKLEVSEHVITGEFDSNRSSLAWYFGYQKERVLELFKRITNQFVETDLSSYLNFYFENNHEFLEETTIKLTTPSKSFFYKLKYQIDELELQDRISIYEKKRMFLFHDLSAYQKLKEELKDIKIEFIHRSI